MANEWPKYTQTMFRHIGISKCGENLWRFVCLDWEGGGTTPKAPSVMGPQYWSKAECYADLHRYAMENYPEIYKD